MRPFEVSFFVTKSCYEIIYIEERPTKRKKVTGKTTEKKQEMR